MPRRPRRSKTFFMLIFAFFHLQQALAAEDVIYKEPRPPADILKARDELSGKKTTTTEKGQTGYFYDPTGKTDPFKSFILIREEVAEKKRRKPRTYLETLELSQLQLTATILSSKGNWAMVRDSKGLGHVIKKGTPIGTHDGFVYQIKDRVVVIREEYRDFRGRVRTRDIDKKLPSFD